MVSKIAAFDGALATGTPCWTEKESNPEASDISDDSKNTDGLCFLDLFDCRPVAGKLARGAVAAGLAAVRHLSPEQSGGDAEMLTSGTTTGEEIPKLQSKLEVIEWAKKHFAEFDLNGDGFMSTKELARQVENPQIKGAVAQTIAALYGMNSKLDFSADEDSLFGGFAGISRADLEKVEKVIKEKQRNGTENPYTAQFLEAADKNANGKLGEEELKAAAAQAGLPDDVQELLDYFVKNQDPLDEVEITDVLHFYSSQSLGDKTDAKLSKMDFLIRKTWENQIENSTLYAEGKDKNGVGMYGIQQGIMGDCYFLASLAAVAQMSPETIKQMIVDNKNGTYTVTFPGAKDEPITISAPTETERGLYNGSSEYGVWGSVLEKAYGAYCGKDFTRRTPLNWTGGLTTTEGADGGGVFLGKLMRLLTGEGADFDWQWFTFNSTTRRKLMEHVGGADKVPVVAWQKPFCNYGLTTVTNHVYSVLDFDPKGDDGGTITLYNPWGHKESISFKQFSRRFMAVAYRDK